MGVDTECDLAVEAGGDPRVQAGVRQIRNRLIAEHLGLSVDAVASGIERSGSLRAFIDTRQGADRTLARIELAAESETPPSEALRAAADPDEPILSGSLVAGVAPPMRRDRTSGSLPCPDRCRDRADRRAHRDVGSVHRSTGVPSPARRAQHDAERLVDVLDRRRCVSPRQPRADPAGVDGDSRRRAVRSPPRRRRGAARIARRGYGRATRRPRDWARPGCLAG